ncbi:hypothetical protein ACLKA7_016881 [Drosophila subpalustris]
MKLLVIVVFLLVSKSLGLSQGHLRIINGSAAKPKQFPYQVGLHCYFSNSKDDYSTCGGTIISKRWILTAAHCLQEPNVSLMKVLVLAGIININTQSELGSVKTWVKRSDTIVHQQYDRYTVAFDIGLIKLPRDLRMSAYIQPAKLPKRNDKNLYVGRTAISSGWGLTDNQRPSDILQFIRLKIISNKQCEKEWNDHLKEGEQKLMLHSFLCVNSTYGLPCLGDSGGPLILDDNSRIIVGIVSHGFDATCRIKIPDIFTRVSSFVDWIEKRTGRLL